MDAISFVLGIKSSHLRSTQLKDLVYRGRVLKTSKINDDGSAAAPGANGHANGHADSDVEEGSQRSSRNDPKMAWVMAVYEDDAGDEQRWKRTITSQGSSEYRINDHVVTAAQYNEALETENILIKARNFLVFQGDVEAIAAQSPQDLTRLIEQISGSLEFKAQYERLQSEAEQAADNQNHQLQRRRGINSEIKQYQEQKKEAENFQKKTEERDDAVVTEILWKLYHFQRGMDEDNSQIKDHQENLKEFRRNVEVSETKLEAARKEQVAAARQVGKIERDITSKERAIRATEPELGKLNEKVAQCMQTIDRVRARISDVSKEKDKLGESIKKAEKDLSTVEKAQEQYDREHRERLKAQGKELSDGDRREYSALRAEARTKTSKNLTSLEQLTRQEKMDEATVNSYKGDIDGTTAKVEKLVSDLGAVAEQKAKIDSDIEQVAESIGAKKKEFSQIQSDRTRTNHLRTELEEKLEVVAKRLKEADDQARQTKNERRMKEMVTDLKRTFPGVKGRVGDLCKPKQKKFDEAVIIALGRDFDSIVVDTEKTATECIQYLKEGKRPPATFLPLDNIKVDAVNTSVKGISGARLTIDAIDFDSSVERAMSYACGSSVVCDSLSIAKQIRFERKIQVKAVTIDGFIIHKAGLMTGGRGPENKGGKRRFEEHDIDNLQRSAQKLKDELEKLPKSDRRGKQEEELQNELASLERRLRNAESESAALERNQTSTARELDNEKKQLLKLKPKFTELTAKLESTQRSVRKFQDAISHVEDEVFSKFCKRLGYPNIREYEAQQGNMEQEAAEKRSRFEVQRHRLRGQLTTAESQFQATQSRIKKLQNELQHVDRDVKAYKKEKSAIEKEISEEQDEVDALKESLEGLKEGLGERNQRVAEARSEVQKRNKDIEARQREIAALETAMQKKSASKFGLLRRCKLEQIQIPLVMGSLDQLPNEDNLLQQDPDAMDVDEGNDDELIQAALEDHGIEIDFEGLDEDLKNVSLVKFQAPGG
jgi:structural maintenance of chromosome 1